MLNSSKTHTRSGFSIDYGSEFGPSGALSGRASGRGLTVSLCSHNAPPTLIREGLVMTWSWLIMVQPCLSSGAMLAPCVTSETALFISVSVFNHVLFQLQPHTSPHCYTCNVICACLVFLYFNQTEYQSPLSVVKVMTLLGSEDISSKGCLRVRMWF